MAGAGKGPERRQEDFKKVQKGYELVDWSEKKKKKNKG